jgi:glutamate synthase (NADPH/NADH) small chain
MAAPVRILGNEDGWVTGIECQMMELGEADASGRRRPRAIPDSEYVIDCDMVVVAIGTRSNPMLTSSEPDLKINEWGYLVVDEDGMTSVPGIFAGGDIVRGAATVILAMGDGKRAARAIERYLGTVAELLPAAQQAALLKETPPGIAQGIPATG